MGNDERPTPEALLAKINAEKALSEKRDRGKLKIFLGFAAGTGKTYAMLSAAQELRRQGIDVVAGYVEPHARPETTALLEGLEQIPFLMVDYKGIKVREFDLDAALERKPAVLLVDELAHTNAEGCRHQKRYQDIEELLAHGISVYTTVNIQHLESLNDVVGSITKIEVRERVPDYIFDEADQVKLVDIEPEELIERMKAGKIYGPQQAQRALSNFFTREKLIALREIALRRMADRVNYLAAEEKKRLGSAEPTGSEHVLTCISPSPTNLKVIRTAARLAYAFHAQFTALYVENRTLQNMDEQAKRQRDENLRLARTLGAKIVTVYGEDIAQQIAEYAKLDGVTKIVMGRTNHRQFFGQRRATLVDKLNEYAPNMDVYVIPDLKNGAQTERKWGSYYGSGGGALLTDVQRLQGTDAAAMCILLAAATGIGFLLRAFGFAEANIIMCYLLSVMATAVATRGYLSSLLASVLSVLLFNYFFTEPFYSLKAYGASYPVTFVMMLAVGILSSWLVTKVQRQSEAYAKRAYRTEILLANSRKLRRLNRQKDVGAELSAQIQKLMNFTVLVYLRENGTLSEPEIYFREGIEKSLYDELRRAYTDKKERAVADWAFQNGHRAGCTTHTLPDAQAIYLPVMDGENVSAVVGLILEERREIGTFEYDIITTMLDEAALVLERIENIEDLRRSQWNLEGME